MTSNQHEDNVRSMDLATSLPDSKREQEDITYRRKSLYVNEAPSAKWGLAFSGGGIRSATFNLGVLQALAQAKFDIPNEVDYQPKLGNPLLARFDFLSTVSGGGYVGSFYSALFRTRVGESVTPAQKATLAYQALQIDPPSRMGNTNSPQDDVSRPVRWLRENGRYLAPNNSGDLFTDIAIALRNLCAIHYVIGISLLTVFLLMFAFRYGITTHADMFGVIGEIGVKLEKFAQPATTIEHGVIWTSPWFGMAGIWIAWVLVPLGVAYWFDQDKPRIGWVTDAFIVAMLLLVSALLLLHKLAPDLQPALTAPRENGIQFALLLFSVILLMANIYFVLTKLIHGAETAIFRPKITRYMSKALLATLILVGVGAIETAGQTLYLWLMTSKYAPVTVFSITATIASLVAGIRQLAPKLSTPSKGGLMSKLPLNAILAMVGIPLFILLLVVWHTLATAIFFHGTIPEIAANGLRIASAASGVPDGFHKFVIGFAVLATIAAGYFLGFINLSGLQPMYGARLTRAYLGASNNQRFAGKRYQVTEPHARDDFTFYEYHKQNSHLGPVHIINVTINATTGRGDQLTRRDRQGMPMAITPAGFSVNGVPHSGDGAAEMSIGRWVGISGAAFTTGLGRGTGIGPALVFGLTNIRLGWWWDSGTPNRYGIPTPWRNQSYLVREFRAQFVGTDEKHWYLSDGGHYENTAVLELLRRRTEFIVCGDCGADPDYEFDDLANLMRIARIDLGADFTLIPPQGCPIFANRVAALASYFADDESELSLKPQGKDNKCLLLYRVSYRESADISYVLVLKPRLIQDAPLDLFEYQSKNPSFPQQTTFDQFFDEAQWESYRKLGVLIASRVFA
jgi:hypothetical protein